MLLLRSIVAAVLAVTAMSLSPVAAQDYPSKAVHIIVPQAAGGGTDTFARAIGQKLGERWGQPVIVENRPGAGGVVGTEFVAKAPPDGYTLLVTYEGSQAINQSLYEKLPFDSLKDFEPIATIAVTPFLLIVSPRSEIKTLQEFIGFARAKPDKLTYGSAGNGSVNHLLGEMLKTEAGIRVVHVPYKGAPQAIADVIGGHVDAAFASVPSVISSVQAGTVRALAVSSAERVAIAPDIPAIAEAGIEKFDVNPWWGILAPAGLNPSVVRKINADVAEILKTPEMQQLLAKQGATALQTSPDEFRRLLERDIEKWRKAVKASGATVN
ncbi:tripartite tricarboxylate transporter substrate binding protein [Bradyrhizobium sp. LHD-71]|uniref:Bug family tripartite tricarboxylate transporter substrate binding protein n=1 Tax=Bradyrhizobium sp. LHD-71 TaxID=3072141 RepID=UPI00280CD7B4|nr:tripartite tricarboxylate transporter substrate binding protein [Bradyrhizobium sp. LHD-71]MDQ8728025.1 tripartite tricarboxylate transporter substrate binding protein [Bradyrhizobium sp. LHD-71]